MSGTVTVFWKNKYFLLASALAAVLNLASWLLVFFRFNEKDINIILYYNILFGVEYQGAVRELFTIPIVGLLLFLMNLVIIRFVYHREKFIFYMMLAASAVIQIFVLIAVVAIVLVNGKGGY